MKEKRTIDKERFRKLHEFQKILGYEFADLTILDEALTHSSFANEARDKSIKDNERLEFLGDAVISFVVSSIIYEMCADMSEGELTKLRAAFVNERYLSFLANNLKISDYLLLGRGEEITGGRSKPSILCGAIEAVLGAIYVDGGIKSVFRVLEKFVRPVIKEKEKLPIFDYKTALQEKVQKAFKTVPTYEVIREYGPSHNKLFEVKVKVFEYESVGIGKSKKEAEREAARKLLEKIDF